MYYPPTPVVHQVTNYPPVSLTKLEDEVLAKLSELQLESSNAFQFAKTHPRTRSLTFKITGNIPSALVSKFADKFNGSETCTEYGIQWLNVPKSLSARYNSDSSEYVKPKRDFFQIGLLLCALFACILVPYLIGLDWLRRDAIF